ncbi:sesquipedalian-2 [Pseudophryne corroboree]|uniref:sesquipedalian-2 n=1 Tax=Pseudophryne corroboree TaxID=495146 RepID=UPI00308188EB
MKLNEKNMVHYAMCDSPADHTGYLYKKRECHTNYKKQWFVLKGNLLFYFEDRESREPSGLVVLEGCTVELCQSNEKYGFTVRFNGSGSQSYILAADSQEAMECWVKALTRANFAYMKLVVKDLERRLESMQKNSVHRKNNQHKVKCCSVAKVRRANYRSAKIVTHSSHIGDTNMEKHLQDISTPFAPHQHGAYWINTSPSVTPLKSLKNTVCPGTTCFSKLHEWYGKDIEELKILWKEKHINQEDSAKL